MSGNNATKAQIGCIRAMLHKLQLTGQKENLVAGASQQRTTSISGLTLPEARELIIYLKKQDPEEKSSERMRRKIISLARSMHWEVNGKADMVSLDAWMVKHSYLKKKINQYKHDELPMLVSQFEKVYKSFLNGI